MFRHFDPYSHGLDRGVETQSDEDDVIRIGYRTTEEQVSEFLSAGIALAKARGEVYMYASEDDDNDDDLPLDRYDKDPVESFDLLAYQRELKAKKDKARAEARAAKAALAAEGSDAKQSDKGGEGGESGAEREARAEAT